MDKTAIKNFAVWARKKLIEDIKQKAYEIGITEKEIKEPKVTTSDTMIIGDRTLNKAEMEQRKSLISRIREKGFNNVIEEAAYTWFNRYIALRFMEVNGYLPAGIRVLSSIEPGKKEPDIIKEALNTDLDLDRELVYTLQDANDTETLYRYLLVKQCNALNEILPGLFEEIEDYTEILLPSNLLSEGSVIRRLVDNISEEDFKDQVEIIGWMYQYYITETNELVYDGSMSKSKIPKELLPAATQIFTPDWVVKYMVENSLGRLWLEGHTDNDIKAKWKYYLVTQHKNDEKVSEVNANIRPEEIKVIDPCMGSGHILVYVFDVLMDIYKFCGFTEREASRLILQNNLYGLDIDDRAYQLAYFAIMMKARFYNRRIFKEKIKLNLCSVQESNGIENSGKRIVDSRKLEELVNYFVQGAAESEKVKLRENIEYLIDVFYDAKEYGSILEVKPICFDAIERRLEDIRNEETGDLYEIQYRNIILKHFTPLVKQAKILSQKYDIVITNPPYLNSSRMNSKLLDYVVEKFPDTKSDFSMIFFQKAMDDFCRKYGYISFITTTSWMFLKSFESIRKKVIENLEFETLVDFGTELFEGKVGHNPIVAWINKNAAPSKKMFAIRLSEYCYSRRDDKEKEFFNEKNRYITNQKDLAKIPGMPIAYWISESLTNSFSNKKLYEYADVQEGLKTGDNESFIRNWYEINSLEINIFGGNKWVHHTKGGAYRRWYGNNEDVLFFKNNGEKLRKFAKSSLTGQLNYFKENITWSRITSGKSSFRYTPCGSIPNMAGLALYPHDNIYYFLGLLNSKVVSELLWIINPTLNYPPGTVAKLPITISNIYKSKIDNIVDKNIYISKNDWDSFETSWDFKKHPLLTHKGSSTTIEQAFNNWSAFTEKQFNQLKANEEELNRIFIEIYGLQDELTPEVEEKDITVRKADRVRDIKSFISYAVGCMFGRYSIDAEGLIYAGGYVVDSGKWIVERIISEVQKNEDSKLHSIDSLAKSNGFSGENLPCDREVSKRGTVCIDKSDAQSGSFDTIKYSGGTGTQINSRISEFLVNCARFTSGSGDANNACPAFKLCEARRSKSDIRLNGGNCKDDIFNNEQPEIRLPTIHYPLSTNWCPLSTIHFLPDMDNVMPITDDEYFEDDIVSRFIEFLKVTFGEDTLEENLDYIADTLGRKSSETARQAIRRYFLKEFYKDHVRVYQKKPIYWLFDSGKQDGFKALIYMHRYDEFTVARVRTDYLHKLQKSYEAEIKRLDIVIDSNASQREKTNARKKKEKILKQMEECLQYDQVIAHVANQRIKIDLDDGVSVNYAKFQGIEVPQGEGRKPLKADLLAKI